MKLSAGYYVVLCLVVGLEGSSGFRDGNLQSRRPIVGALHLSREPTLLLLQQPRRSGTSLFSKDDKDVESESSSDQDSFLPPVLVEDPGTLLSDLLALAIACQLLGLLDVLSDPSFYQNGGWLQPILAAGSPPAPSTLPVLVQRFALNSVVYIAAATLVGAFSQNAVDSPKAIRITALKAVVTYSLARVALGLFLFAVVTNSNSVDAVETLRECYFVALMTTAGRYSLYLLYYR